MPDGFCLWTVQPFTGRGHLIRGFTFCPSMAKGEKGLGAERTFLDQYRLELDFPGMWMFCRPSAVSRV